MSHTEILPVLRDAPLFAGVSEHVLKDLARRCTIWRLDVGEYVRINADDIPTLLIAKGCIAALATTGFGRYERIALALLMPTQLLCEFEYFGNKLPETAGLKAIDETEIISIPAKALGDLLAAYPLVLNNLAKSLVEKINICNFHLEAVSQTQGDKKIATMLSGFIKIAEWVPPDYGDVQRRSPMRLSIVWDIELLARYLSSDHRTIKGGLVDLVRANLIEIEWLDESLSAIPGVGVEEIEGLGRRNSKIDEKTGFRVTIKNPGKLEEYCGG